MPGEDEWRKVGVMESTLQPFDGFVIFFHFIADNHDWFRISSKRPHWS